MIGLAVNGAAKAAAAAAAAAAAIEREAGQSKYASRVLRKLDSEVRLAKFCVR